MGSYTLCGEGAVADCFKAKDIDLLTRDTPINGRFPWNRPGHATSLSYTANKNAKAEVISYDSYMTVDLKSIVYLTDLDIDKISDKLLQ